MMIDLPLFPLNTVVFPGMPVALHIFEPRYQKMVRACIDQREAFGVVLIKHGLEAGGPAAEPYDFGCTARVMRVENLSDGRMNILAVGEQRFRIDGLDRELEYLRGEVEYAPMVPGEGRELELAGLALRPWVMRYLQVLSDAELINQELNTLPAHPIELANLGAYLLQVPPELKQILLAAEDSIQFVNSTCRAFRREVTLLANILQNDLPEREDTARSN